MEDSVSMGATSANKILHILELAQQVVAIELLCAAQMLDFRKPLKPGIGVQKAYEIVRSFVPVLEQDRVLAPDIATMTRAVKEKGFNAVEKLLSYKCFTCNIKIQKCSSITSNIM